MASFGQDVGRKGLVSVLGGPYPFGSRACVKFGVVGPVCLVSSGFCLVVWADGVFRSQILLSVQTDDRKGRDGPEGLDLIPPFQLQSVRPGRTRSKCPSAGHWVFGFPFCFGVWEGLFLVFHPGPWRLTSKGEEGEGGLKLALRKDVTSEGLIAFTSITSHLLVNCPLRYLAVVSPESVIGRAGDFVLVFHPGPWRLTSKGEEGEGGLDLALLRE
eukprot:scaffold91465_cov37-Cyclotella_meneghiniana.AAC.4